MTVRADILAGRAVILVNIQDNIDKSLKTIRSKMRVFANNMSEIGGDLFRGGLAGSVAAIFPVKEFTSFQDSMLFLQSKLKDTGVDIKALEGLIRELGRTTSFTSREVAEAGAVLAQAGLGQKVGATLQPTLDLARGARLDLPTAGRILANLMSTYKIDTEEANETASKIITAARLGTTDVVDLGEALKYSATTFRSLNIGLNESLGMITQLSNMGSRASSAGTSLQAAFSNLAAKPKQLADIGIAINDLDLENTVEVFRKITKALESFSRQEKQAILSNLFNIRGGRGVSGIILQDLDDLQEIIDKIDRAGKEAREMAVLMDSQLGGVGRRALSAFQEALISIGETTEGPLTKIGTNLQLIFQNIGNLVKANPRLVQTMLAIPPIALAAGVSFLLLSTAISKVLMLVGPLLSANALIFKSLGAIAGANIKVAKTMFDAGKMRLMGMGMGPNIPVFATMGAGVRGIERAFISLGNTTVFDRLFLSPQPMAALLNMFPRVEAAFGNIAKRFGSLRTASAAAGRSSLGGIATTAITRPVLQIMNALEAAMQKKGFTMGIKNAFVFGFQNAAKPIADLFEGIMRGATARGFSGRAPFISSLQIGMNSVLGTLPRLYAGLRSALRGLGSVDYVNILYRSFQGLWRAARGTLSVVSKLRYAFTLPGLLIIAEILLLFGDKIPIIKDALEGLGKAFSNAFKNIGNMFRDMGDGLSWFQTGLSAMFSGNIEIGLEHIGKGFRSIGKAITEGVSYTWQNFVKDIEPGAMMIRNAIKGIIAVFEALVATIGAIFGTAFEKGAILVKSDGSLLELFQSIFSPENFKEFFSFIVAFIGEIGKGLITLVEFIGNVLIDIKKVFMAILEGIAKLPILGDAARAGLEAADDPNNPNAARIKALRAGIASREDILSGVSGQFVSDAERAAIEKIIADAKAELATLGVSSPTTKPPAQLRSELQTSIDKILAGLQDMTNPLATRPVLNDRDRQAAEVAAEFGGISPRDLERWNEFLDREAGRVGNLMGPLSDEELAEERKRLQREIWNLPDIPEAPQVAAAKAEVAPIAQAIKAVVGDFESTRYRQLQFAGTKLDEKRNELLSDIDDGIARVEDKLQQPVFV